MSGVRHSSPERLLAILRRRIVDARVIEAIASVPRERFVGHAERRAAYTNQPLGIGCGQTISQPLVVARMCELLNLCERDRVLDVGTGSGYHAAVLARLAAHVWSVERYDELSRQAAQNLIRAGVANVSLLTGDGCGGLPAQAPFDAINVGACSVGRVPPALEAQLGDGGRLVAPVKLAGAGERLVLVTRGRQGLAREILDPVRFVPLIGADMPPQ